MVLPSEPLPLKLPLADEFQRVRDFRARTKTRAEWRISSPEEYQWLKDQPELERLGDFLFLAPAIEDELWLLIERMWNGLPDPPMYVFLAYGLNRQLITARDFDTLPKAWTLPDASKL